MSIRGRLLARIPLLNHFLFSYKPTLIWSKANATTQTPSRHVARNFVSLSSRVTGAAAARDKVAKNKHHGPHIPKKSRNNQKGAASFSMMPLTCESFPPVTPTDFNTIDLNSQRQWSASSNNRQMGLSTHRAAQGAYKSRLSDRYNIVFEDVSPLDMDTKAERHVEDFFRHNSKRQQKEQGEKLIACSTPLASANNGSLEKLIFHNLPKSNLKRCTLSFHIRGCLVTAMGQSTRSRTARVLCFMHAVRLMDYYAVQRGGELPSPPLPLQEKRVLDEPPSGGRCVGGLQPPCRPALPEGWAGYTTACAAYVRRRAALSREQALRAMRIPPSTNDIVNRASALIQVGGSGRRGGKEQEEKGLGEGGDPQSHLALHRLNATLHNASELIQTARVAPKIFAATLILEEATGLVATGVGSSSKEAKRRCAVHALCILRLLQEQQQPLPRTASASPGALPSSAEEKVWLEHSDRNRLANSAPINSILISLNRHYDTMYRLYRFLFDDISDPVVEFTKQDNTFVCEFSLSGITCKGQGISRFEAERAAVKAAFSELELYDERLKAIQDFMTQYPSVSTSKIPKAVLPTQLSERIRSGIQKINDQIPSEGRHHDPCTTAESLKEVDKAPGDVEEAMLENLKRNVIREDSAYAERLRRNLRALHANPIFLEKFYPRQSSLSIATVKQQILETVAANRVTIICGTTGCGKTTQVPQYLFDHEILEGRGGQCNIIVTQPRRITAFSVADRIAQERLSVLGEDVGYAVRLEAKVGRHINLYTSGVLLHILSSQPNLEHVSHLIIDEVHERDINCDVVLALAKQILVKNTTLKIILMSATMHSSQFASYFGGAQVITIEGSVYPVRVRYLENIASIAANPGPDLRSHYSPMFDIVDGHKQPKLSDFRSRRGGGSCSRKRFNSPLTPQKTDYQLIAYLVYYSILVDLHGDTKGKSILVFLPGWKEILAAKQAIEAIDGISVNQLPNSKLKFKIILLHSTVDGQKQRECFQPAPDGFVKVVLATNIAESGITIDDAAVVIDTGLIKQTTWAPRMSSYVAENFSDAHLSGTVDNQQTASFSTQLCLNYASRANATQRKGRAGRTQSGFCYRIFTKATWEVLPEFQEPEIHRVPLTQVLLKLLSLGYSSPKTTLATFMEPPSSTNVEVSMTQLKNIDAVTADEKLTSLGYYLSRLPCDPRIGKMVMMGAVLHCLDSVLTVAASTEVCPFLTSRELALETRRRRSLFSRGSQSDHISFLNVYNGFCAVGEDTNFAQFNYLHLGNLEMISRYKLQYYDILRRSGLISHDELLSVAPKLQTMACKGIERESGDSNYPGSSDFEDEMDGSIADVSGSSVYNGRLFVDASVLSRWALNMALVKSCLCAAFFPNVAVLDPLPMFDANREDTRSASRKLRLRTKTHANITAATESVCYRLGAPRKHDAPTREELMREIAAKAQPPTMDNPSTPAMFYVYQEIFAVREANKIFLTNVSSISLWSLLLFGASDANTQYFDSLGLCVVDGWIFIRIEQHTFHTLLDLRHTLHDCIWRRYKDPTHDANNAALCTLRELIKEVLEASLDINDPTHNRLVDSGVIVPIQTKDSVNFVVDEMEFGDEDELEENDFA